MADSVPHVPLIAGLSVPATALVTGASSGIGLAATAALLARDDVARVFALSRHATATAALSALTDTHGARLQRVDADLTDEASVDAAVARIAERTDDLHLLLNAAGVLHADDLQPEKSLPSVSAASLQRVFALNAFAPLLLAKALLPLLPHGAPCVLASLSARVGSIGDNALGGWISYRSSKAALNQIARTAAIEISRMNPSSLIVAVHPGTVSTSLSEPFSSGHARSEPDEAASRILRMLDGLEPGDTGKFYAYDGTSILW